MIRLLVAMLVWCCLASVASSQVVYNKQGIWYITDPAVQAIGNIDCTGTNDATTALQAIVNAMSNGYSLLFPEGCTVKLSDTINIVSRNNLRFASYATSQPSSFGNPIFTWVRGASVVNATASNSTTLTINSVSSGTLHVHDTLGLTTYSGVGTGIHANGPGNPYITSFGTFNGTSGTVNLSTAVTVTAQSLTAYGMMFNVESSGYIVFDGFTMNNNIAASGNIGNFINIDMDEESGSTGTRNVVTRNTFQMNAVANPIFAAVSIAQSTVNNQENHQVNNNFFACTPFLGGGIDIPGAISSVGAMTSGLNTLTAANNPFVAGMVGHTVWVSYPSGHGLLRTTITAFNNSGSVTTFANAADNISAASVVVGQSFGTGIYLGPSGNAIHEQFDSNIAYDCDYGIRADGGSFSMHHLQGGFGDYGVYVNNNALQDWIDFYENENDLRGIDLNSQSGKPFLITNMRGSNTNQLADGFLKVAGQTTLMGAEAFFAIPSNGVFVSAQFGGQPFLTSIGNQYNQSFAAVGYGKGVFATYPPISINDYWGSGEPGVSMFGCPVGLGVTIPCAYVNGSMALQKITATAAAPGAGVFQFEAVAGTNAGTCKLIAYAGTSATPVTVIDNVGSGC